MTAKFTQYSHTGNFKWRTFLDSTVKSTWVLLWVHFSVIGWLIKNKLLGWPQGSPNVFHIEWLHYEILGWRVTKATIKVASQWCQPQLRVIMRRMKDVPFWFETVIMRPFLRSHKWVVLLGYWPFVSFAFRPSPLTFVVRILKFSAPMRLGEVQY